MKKYLFTYNENDRAVKKALTMLFWRKRGVPNYYDYDIWYIMYYGIPKFLYYKTKAKFTHQDFERLTGKSDKYFSWIG